MGIKITKNNLILMCRVISSVVFTTPCVTIRLKTDIQGKTKLKQSESNGNSLTSIAAPARGEATSLESS